MQTSLISKTKSCKRSCRPKIW